MATAVAMSSTTSPRSSLAKLVLYPKPKPFKVMVLGQSGVGKSALVVRFITRRFIGDYDPNLEKIYAFQTVIDNEMVYFEILDSAGESHESEYTNLESNIRWAEAFILMYSVTDKCSFDECHRLKFLINYNKRRRRLASSMKEGLPETPVVLVGNKADQVGDRMVSTEEGQRRSKEIGCICFHEISVRESIDQESLPEALVVLVGNKAYQVRDHMVSTEEGQRRSKEIGCVCFHEISVRESIDQVWGVFRDARRFWRVGSKWNRGRSDADVHPAALGRPLARAASDTASETVSTPSATFGRRWTDVELEEEEDTIGMARSDSTCSSGRSEGPEGPDEFRARASTDSRLPPRPARARHPPPCRPMLTPVRRMSVAMKGNNPSTY